jgi:hypothetical protein
MKFQFKVLVAALALAATLPASAAMTKTAGVGGGDSSLILTLLDTTAGVSATFDLGFSKSSFVQTANGNWDLSTGNYASAWSSFWGVASTANTQYSVFAGDALGSASGDQSMFTTVASTWVKTSNTTLGQMQASFDTYIVANNAIGNHGAVADGASFATSLTGGSAYAGVGPALGTAGKIGNFGGDTNALIGTNMSVFNIVRNGTSGVTEATATKLSVAGFNPYFNMSNTGALTYVAAVPEADTSAMMLAGLGLMGFIARRRRNNVA